jgi:hypothetical protein
MPKATATTHGISRKPVRSSMATCTPRGQRRRVYEADRSSASILSRPTWPLDAPWLLRNGCRPHWSETSSRRGFRSVFELLAWHLHHRVRVWSEHDEDRLCAVPGPPAIFSINAGCHRKVRTGSSRPHSWRICTPAAPFPAERQAEESKTESWRACPAPLAVTPFRRRMLNTIGSQIHSHAANRPVAMGQLPA